jgi:hypothetical protein
VEFILGLIGVGALIKGSVDQGARDIQARTVSQIIDEFNAQWRAPDELVKRCEEECARRSNYDAIWERIEKYKEDGGVTVKFKPGLWALVGKERFPIFNSKGQIPLGSLNVYSDNYRRMVRLYVSTFDKVEWIYLADARAESIGVPLGSCPPRIETGLGPTLKRMFIHKS